MRIKLLSRLLCALLSVLMLVCMIPAVTVSAVVEDVPKKSPEEIKAYVENHIAEIETYETPEERFEKMTEMYNNGVYSLRCDTVLGIVAYRNEKTGEIMFTNPWDTSKETTDS